MLQVDAIFPRSHSQNRSTRGLIHFYLDLYPSDPKNSTARDFWRDLVDRCKHVSPDVNRAEGLNSVSLDNVDLEHAMHQLQSIRPFR